LKDYLGWFVRRWLVVVLCGVPLGILVSYLRGYQNLADPIGYIVAGALIIAASVVDFLRGKATRKKYSPQQSLRRARPALPPRSQLDLDRPIIGVYVRGALAGAHSLINVYQDDDGEWLGKYATLDGHFFPRLVDGLRDIPWSEFNAELDDAGIWVIPQSAYTDNVAEILFGKRAASTKMHR